MKATKTRNGIIVEQIRADLPNGVTSARRIAFRLLGHVEHILTGLTFRVISLRQRLNPGAWDLSP